MGRTILQKTKESNGISYPRKGTKAYTLWRIFERHYQEKNLGVDPAKWEPPSRKEIMLECIGQFNRRTASCQHFYWRKFYGIPARARDLNVKARVDPSGGFAKKRKRHEPTGDFIVPDEIDIHHDQV